MTKCEKDKAIMQGVHQSFTVDPLLPIPTFWVHGIRNEARRLTGEPPWRDYADPGFHRPLGGNAPQQSDLDVTFAVASSIFQSQENVHQAINKALTVAVPEAYKRADGDVGPAVYVHSHGRPYGDPCRRHPTEKVRKKNSCREGGGNVAVGSTMDPNGSN